jgi:hypothetical protein
MHLLHHLHHLLDSQHSLELKQVQHNATFSSCQKHPHLNEVPQVMVDINDNELERARPRHLLENTADYNQGTNTAGCLSQEGRHLTDARIFIDLSHDVGLVGLQVVSPFARGMPGRDVTYCRTAPPELHLPNSLVRSNEWGEVTASYR